MNMYNVYTPSDEQQGWHRRPLIGKTALLLSALWTYVLLSTLFRDVHELFRPGFVEGLVDNTVHGVSVDETQVLLGGVLLQLPLALVPLTLVMSRTVARISNIVGAALMGLGVLSIWPKDADDYVFGGFQLIAITAIIAIAARWSADHESEPVR